MFLTTNKLLTRFKDNLKDTDKVDIAVAWATSGPALDHLEDWGKVHPGRIRALIGTSGNATDPIALERLAKIGELRLADENSILFHPKVYIFHGQPLTAWVGSANLTRGGFQNNEEAIFETTQGQGVLDWFEERWKECDELRPDDISNYSSRWEQNKPQPGFKSVINGIDISTFAGVEFKPLEGRENILEAFKIMCETLTEGAAKFPNIEILTRGRSDWPPNKKRQDVYWQRDHGFWFSFRSPEANNNKFWNGFGLDDLQQKNRPPLKPTVEINPPLKSEVGFGGKNGGALLCDEQGNIYLGHTGQINGVRDFLDQYRKQTSQGNIVTVKRSREIILLGRIDSFDLNRKVSEFVRSTATIKHKLRNK